MTLEGAANKIARLSSRERECLRLVSQRYSSKEIGRQLSISSLTVDDHVRKAMRKLGADSRSEAARLLVAQENGLPSAWGPEPPGMEEPAPSAAPSPHADPQQPTAPRRNTWPVPLRLAAILAIAAGSALAFGALLAGARALQDIALTLLR